MREGIKKDITNLLLSRKEIEWKGNISNTFAQIKQIKKYYKIIQIIVLNRIITRNILRKLFFMCADDIKLRNIFKKYLKVYELLDKIPQEVNFIFNKVYNENDPTYITGGLIRDALLGNIKETFDIDIATTRKYFGYDSEKDVGKIKSIKLIKEWDYDVEISVFKNYEELLKDAMKRDFTINAILYNPITEEVIDISGNGINDAFNKILRFNGIALERLLEDTIRGFRFYRFLKEKNLIPNKKSLSIIRKNWDYIMKNSDSERVRQEIEKIVKI